MKIQLGEWKSWKYHGMKKKKKRMEINKCESRDYLVSYGTEEKFVLRGLWLYFDYSYAMARPRSVEMRFKGKQGIILRFCLVVRSSPLLRCDIPPLSSTPTCRRCSRRCRHPRRRIQRNRA